MYDYGSYTTTTQPTVDSGAAAALAGFGIVYTIVMLAVAVLTIVGMWKIFTKAGKEGWKCLIPFYNTYLLFEIAGMNGWMFLIMFIPFVGSLIALILLAGGLAKQFGQGTGFAVGLFFLTPIFMMILGFGSAQYQGAAGQVAQAAPVQNQPVDQPVEQPVENQFVQNQPEQMQNDQNQNQNQNF